MFSFFILFFFLSDQNIILHLVLHSLNTLCLSINQPLTPLTSKAQKTLFYLQLFFPHSFNFALIWTSCQSFRKVKARWESYKCKVQARKKGRRKRKPHTPSIGLCIDSQGCWKGLWSCPYQSILICSIKSVRISTGRRYSARHCVFFSGEPVCETGLPEVTQAVKGCPSLSVC